MYVCMCIQWDSRTKAKFEQESINLEFIRYLLINVILNIPFEQYSSIGSTCLENVSPQ